MTMGRSVDRPDEDLPLEEQPWIEWHKITLQTQTMTAGAEGLGITSFDLRGTLKFARWPFLFVDRIVEYDPVARRIVGLKAVTATECVNVIELLPANSSRVGVATTLTVALLPTGSEPIWQLIAVAATLQLPWLGTAELTTTDSNAL